MKRNLFLSLNLIVLLTASLAAQGRTPKRDGFSGGLPDRGRLGAEGDHLFELRDRCCPVIPPRRVLDRVLQLDEDQMEDVAVLAEEIAGAVGPLREQLRGNMMAQKDELGSDSPDACTVGELLLEGKRLQAEICAIVQSYADDFAEILYPDQLEKWLTIKDRFCHRRPPRHHGPDHPDGDGEN